MPIDGCLVNKVEHSSDRASSEHVVVEVGVDKVCGHNRFAQGFGSIVGKDLGHLSMD